MENKNTNPFEVVEGQNGGMDGGHGPSNSSVKMGSKTKVWAMIIAIMAVVASASGYFIYTLRTASELPPSLEAVTGTGFIAGPSDIGYSYEADEITKIKAKVTGTGDTRNLVQRDKLDVYFYAERELSIYDVMMNVHHENYTGFKAQVIHYNTQDKLFYMFPGGIYKNATGTKELKQATTGDKYAELKAYKIPAFSPFFLFTNQDFQTFSTERIVAATASQPVVSDSGVHTYVLKSFKQAPSAYDYNLAQRDPGWHMSILTKAQATAIFDACRNGITGVWPYNPMELDPKKQFGTAAVLPATLTTSPTNPSYVMWINKKVAKGACTITPAPQQTPQTQSGTPSQNSAPKVLKVSSTKPDGAYKAGVSIPIVVEFDKDIAVTGTGGKAKLKIRVAMGEDANSFHDLECSLDTSNNKKLNCPYTVIAGHNSLDLNYYSTTALFLVNTVKITDKTVTTLDAVLTLPALAHADSLAGHKALVIDTVRPSKPVYTVELDSNAAPSSIKNNLVTVAGTAEAGGTVEIEVITCTTASTCSAAGIKHTITLGADITDFEHEFNTHPNSEIEQTPYYSIKVKAKVTDKAGNISEVDEKTTIIESPVVDPLAEEVAVAPTTSTTFEASSTIPADASTTDSLILNSIRVRLPLNTSEDDSYTLDTELVSEVSVKEDNTSLLLADGTKVCTNDTDTITKAVVLLTRSRTKSFDSSPQPEFLVIYFKNKHASEISVSIPEGLVTLGNKKLAKTDFKFKSDFLGFLREFAECVARNTADLNCIKDSANFTTLTVKETEIFEDMFDKPTETIEYSRRTIIKTLDLSATYSCSSDYPSLCSICVGSTAPTAPTTSTSTLRGEEAIQSTRTNPLESFPR